MNRKELNEMCERFKRNEERLKSLNKGDFIFERDGQDPIGFSYFKHEVVSVDLDKMCVHTWSSLGEPKTLYGFYLPEEAGMNKPKSLI